MGEFDLLQHVYKSNDRLPAELLLPPGDDMAALRVGQETLLLATDQVIDGVHFDLARTPIDLIGRKAVSRSVSDIAAMAGLPTASLVSVALPAGFSNERATALFDSMRQAAEAFHCPLVGGDIARFNANVGGPLTCSVSVLAAAGNGRFITRAGAKPGDCVYVTGQLGGSLQDDGLGHHLTFTPRVNVASALLDQLGDDLHAMIDISDGLGRDASHIAEQSDVRIELDGPAIPVRAGVSIEQALSDGEDYELCFTAAGAADLPEMINGVAITQVGRVVQCDNQSMRVVVRSADGTVRPVDSCGWEHA